MILPLPSIKKLWDAVTKAGEAAYDITSDLVVSGITYVYSAIIQAIVWVVGGMSDLFVSAWQTITEIFTSLPNPLKVFSPVVLILIIAAVFVMIVIFFKIYDRVPVIG